MSWTQIDKFRHRCREEEPDCWICGEPIDYISRGTRWSFNVDHYIPRYHGGTDDEKNLRPSHVLCNGRRGHRLPEQTIWIGTKEDGRWHNETFDSWEKRLRREMSAYARHREKIRKKKKPNPRSHIVGVYPIDDPIKIGPGLDDWPPATPQSDEQIRARVRAYQEARKRAHADGTFDERLLPPPEYRNQTRRIEDT
ncbi:HNH endonuclease [Gordonia phage Linetti]|nr:HNH endonuclease [Gordonia phage Linetti]